MLPAAKPASASGSVQCGVETTAAATIPVTGPRHKLRLSHYYLSR